MSHWMLCTCIYSSPVYMYLQQPLQGTRISWVNSHVSWHIILQPLEGLGAYFCRCKGYPTCLLPTSMTTSYLAHNICAIILHKSSIRWRQHLWWDGHCAAVWAAGCPEASLKPAADSFWQPCMPHLATQSWIWGNQWPLWVLVSGWDWKQSLFSYLWQHLYAESNEMSVKRDVAHKAPATLKWGRWNPWPQPKADKDSQH